MSNEATELKGISSSLLPVAIKRILEIKDVPFVRGSPGIGKSDIIREVAISMNLLIIDFRLSQCDPTDLQGFPGIKDGRSTYYPNINFPLESDSIPKGYSGWLLFLDELPNAPKSVQDASYKIILDKMVGQHRLHPNVYICAAGNLDTDKSNVTRMNTALQSRLSHLTLNVNPDNWLSWAVDNDIDFRVTSFIEFRKELLHSFNPNHDDNTFACPRTWASVSRLIKGNTALDEIDQTIIQGTVGMGPGLEFKVFTSIFASLPTVKEIMNNPSTAEFIPEPSVFYALAGLVSSEVTLENIDDLSAFTERLPPEFQVVAWKAAIRRNRAIVDSPYIIKWMSDNVHLLQL